MMPRYDPSRTVWKITHSTPFCTRGASFSRLARLESSRVLRPRGKLIASGGPDDLAAREAHRLAIL